MARLLQLLAVRNGELLNTAAGAGLEHALIDGTGSGTIVAMETTIDKAGRLVVPKAVREASRLRPGTRVRFRVSDGRIEIEPVPMDVTLKRRGSIVVAVPREGRPALTAAEVDDTTASLRTRASSASKGQPAG
ncbi:MAG: AbrB/MazE/SpoVT family DNA-binding domain-containing protein [Gemmatimonadetes bacterium]|nr:AbrB/MazE/SpoVT family DNA-binding domain-containing protein [Gemmatimonadota bacterium]MYG35306.1 AbrB/MazE/SpoVT family DNA-binding domain-containing protein [Gemmatimonadota bacterium]MYJ18680.1 AbrB/MazE/SpoVT family DNA-binding domain-containing protein [Gemmatimonadota bacterium]